MPRLLPTVLVAATVLAGLTACGSSSGPSASTDAVPSTDVVSAVKTDAALHAALPAAVRSRGSITVGTTLQPGTAGLPYSGKVGGTDVGLQVDLREAVAKVLGVTVNVQNGTFPTIIPGTQNGKYDVGLDNFGVTAERVKVVDFATYLTDGQSFLGSKNVKIKKVSRLTDLCGYTVATAPGSTFQQILTQGAGQCAAAGKKKYTVQYFADSAPVFLGLANGKIDINFGPTLSLKYDAKHIAGTRFLGQYSSTPVGFVTAKNSGLAASLSAAVNTLIADGDYRRILAKWGLAGSAIARSQVNPKPSL